MSQASAGREKEEDGRGQVMALRVLDRGESRYGGAAFKPRLNLARLPVSQAPVGGAREGGEGRGVVA